MSAKRTPEECLAYLKSRYPYMGEDTSILLELIARVEKELPNRLRHLSAFKWYWGLTPEGPLTYVEIGPRLGVSTSRARELSLTADRILKHPDWWKAYAPKEEAPKPEAQSLQISVAKKEPPLPVDPIRPVLFLANKLSDAASIRAMAKKLLRRAEKHHAYYADEKTGKISRYAIDLRSLTFRLSPTKHTLESLEYWLRLRLLHEHECNQRGFTNAHKAVNAKGVMIGIGSPTKTRVIVVGKILSITDNVVHVDTLSMTRDGKNLLQGGKPTRVEIRVHKISQIALYKPWST